MKNIQFKKLILSSGLLIFVLVYFQFKRDISRDNRIDVQAVHTCANDHFYGRCIYGCDAGYTCKGYPSCQCVANPTPTKIPTPTPLNPCDGYNDNICSAANPYTCEKFMCTYDGAPGDPGDKCYRCTQTGCPDPCHVDTVCTYPDAGYCGYVPASGPTPTSPQVTCQPFSCHDVCGLAGCSDQCGSVDGCGGTSCSSCSGGTPVTTAPVNTPTDNPSCSPQCAADPCRTNLCSDQICIGTCGGNCIGALTCYPPVLSSLTIKNSDQVTVPVDANNRNHIYELLFRSSSVPRRVIFEVEVFDSNGYDNIASVNLRWNGNVYSATYDSGNDNFGLYKVTIDFTAGDNNSGTYPIEVNIVDDNGKTTGWISSGREFKVWNGQVEVSGNLYDGSYGQACNTNGFTYDVESNLNYTSLLYRDTVLGGGISATVSLPNSYGPNSLTWGQTYQPVFNVDLSATDRLIRVIDLGVGTTSCPTTDEFDLGTKVSAYSTSPAADIDFSFVRTQEGWFQVVGAGVKAKNQIGSGVPVTAPVAIRALTLSKALADNGLVSFTSFSNINGFNESSGYGLSNNWWIDRSTNDSTTYNYQYFYNNLYVNRGLGTTGTDWISKPSEGIYYVNGNLTIDSNFTLAAGKTLLVVVRGTITISDTVDRVDGILIADGGIIASGSSANQLVINGVLYSKGNIQLSRSYTNKLDNNSSSAVVVSYQPNLIFNLPGTVMRVLSGWKEE